MLSTLLKASVRAPGRSGAAPVARGDVQLPQRPFDALGDRVPDAGGVLGQFVEQRQLKIYFLSLPCS